MVDTSLLKRLAEVTARGLQSSQARHKATKSTQPPKLWLPKMVGSAPNALLRSSLFSASAGTNINLMESTPVCASGSHSIICTGAKLEQADLDVLLAVLELFKGIESQTCKAQAATILGMLKRGDDGRNHALLARRLSRLTNASLQVYSGSLIYEGSLIDSCVRNPDSKRFEIQLNTELRLLFGHNEWTAIDLNTRHELSGYPLAQWLHAFYSTHANPLPYKIDTLRSLCGSTNRHTSGFKQELKKALAAVQCAALKRGKSFEYTVDNKVHIQHDFGKNGTRRKCKREAPESDSSRRAQTYFFRAQTYILRAQTYRSPCAHITRPVQGHRPCDTKASSSACNDWLESKPDWRLIDINQLIIVARRQAQSAQAQPFGPKGAHISGSEANRPIDDECAKHESRGGRPRPSVSRGQSPGVGAKRSTIQIDGQASSLSPAGASMAMPISAQAETRRAKANGQVGAPAQHPIWMVERCETTPPKGSAKGVQPEQGRLRVQRKGAWRLGLGTKPSFSSHHLYGEHLPYASQRANQCALRTDGALAKAWRSA